MERILLVDTERALKAALATALRQDGYEVVLADSGETALELAEHTPLDLVVTEARLRGMDGLDLLRRIRERQPQAAGVVATAYGSLESAVEALRLGCADYVTKPFRVAELRRLVARVLAARRPTGAGGSPFRIAAIPHELLTGPGETRWTYDLWRVGPGRRGILFAAAPRAGREVLRAVVRAEAAHRPRPRPVLASAEAALGERLDAFLGLVDVPGRVLRFATGGAVDAWLCGAGFGTDVLTGRHDDIGVAIEASDRLVVASRAAAAADPNGSPAEAESLRTGACLRVGIGSLVRGLAEERLTLRPPCSPADYIERSEEAAGQAGLGEADVFRVATAVAEAVQNAERHAYGGSDGLIEVRYLRGPSDLMVEVSDTGRGFDTAAADPVPAGGGELYRESGRGFLVMRQLMDAVEVRSAAGCGTTVRMEKGRAQC